MKSSKIKINFLPSLVGLMLAIGVVFLSASSQSTSADSSPALTVAIAEDPAATIVGTSIAANSADITTLIEPPTATPPIVTNTSGYTNGTYTASASYPVRGSYESIEVTLTIQKGIISSASISQSGSDPESRRYQNSFTSAYKQYVIGKSINSLNLSRVSGASLTTSGFNDAVDQIKSKAHA